MYKRILDTFVRYHKIQFPSWISHIVVKGLFHDNCTVTNRNCTELGSK